MDEYVDCKTKMRCICPQGHLTTKRFDAFKQGKRCDICAHIGNRFKQRFTQQEMEQKFRDGGCELLDVYKGCHVPVKYRCNCGRVSYIAYEDFRVGKRCKVCGKEKQTKSMYLAGTCKSSTQQRYLNNLFKGELNYAVGSSFLDIAFPDEKIYIEYDGSGHGLGVKKKSYTKEEFEENEKRRNYALMRRGWKCIRIKSKRDRIPSDSTLITMFEQGKMILDDHHSVIFDIDNNSITYQEITYPYDFGETKRMRADSKNTIPVTTAIPYGDIRDTVGSVA